MARHVIDPHFEPTFNKLNGIPQRGEQLIRPDFRHVINTHFATSFIESNGIL